MSTMAIMWQRGVRCSTQYGLGFGVRGQVWPGRVGSGSGIGLNMLGWCLQVWGGADP